MKRRARGLLALLALSLALSTALAGCGSSGPTFGPSWARFQADLPSTPKAGTGSSLTELHQEFPGASDLVAYYVTTGSGTNLFAPGAPVPAPTTYGVILVKFPESSTVTSDINSLKTHIPGLTPVSRDGYAGASLVEVASQNPFAQGTKVTDPKAFLGALVIGKGTVVMDFEVVTKTAAEASAFIASVKPAS